MMILENVALIIHEPSLENQYENIFNDIVWYGDVVRQGMGDKTVSLIMYI